MWSGWRRHVLWCINTSVRHHHASRKTYLYRLHWDHMGSGNRKIDHSTKKAYQLIAIRYSALSSVAHSQTQVQGGDGPSTLTSASELPSAQPGSSSYLAMTPDPAFPSANALLRSITWEHCSSSAPSSLA